MQIRPNPRVVVSSLLNNGFVSHTHRPNLAMRDLGIGEATNGQIGIHIVKATKPYDRADDIGAHHHIANFQYFFVLKGWQRMMIDDVGEVVVHAGDGWLQSGEVDHEVLDYSDDLEVLCINMPQKFQTVPRTDSSAA